MATLIAFLEVRHVIVRALLCSIAMFVWLAPLTAEEAATDGVGQSNPTAQKEGEALTPELVELLDGADSAEGALRAFVTASKASDDEAALKMVDPPIQKLLIPEIAIERFAIDSIIIDHGIFGENKKRVPGMIFHFAWRDLINLKSVEILETRIVDEDRVVFKVYSTEWSYHDDGNSTTVQDILVVRRSGKWYVVRLFGMLTDYFRVEHDEPDKSKRPILQVKKGTAELPNRRNADYELQFNLPIEVIHAELVECAKSQQMTDCLAVAVQLQRLFKVIENQAKRGRIRSREELEKELHKAGSRIEDLMEKIPQAIDPSLKKLANLQVIYETESKGK